MRLKFTKMQGVGNDFVVIDGVSRAITIPPHLSNPLPNRHFDVAGSEAVVAVLSMGNPHAGQTVAAVDSAPVATEGPVIERHPRFPRRVNAAYMQIVTRAHIRLRVWERGAGETLACGTGACAE